MPTLDTRAGRLDVLVHPGNAHSLVFTWPAPLTSRTFTGTLGTATALTVTVDGATVTVDFTEAQTAGVTTATWWKLTETTSGTQDRIVGKVIPNRYGTASQDDEVAVIEDETTVTVTVLGEPGPAGEGGGGGGAVDSVDGRTGAVDLSDRYQPVDSDLTAIAALTTTSFGRALLALADATAGRTALGLGTAATSAASAFDPAGSAAAAQAASQPLDADLTTLAAANNSTVLAATTASFTTADETKLDGIVPGADITDPANVDAAGAVMNTDTSTAAMQFGIDEDDMASNSATKFPTQQSVKAYVDANSGGDGSVAAALFGSDADYARPDAPLVIWVGTLTPNNAIATDLVFIDDLDSEAPTAPVLSATDGENGRSVLTWTAATDNTGVAGYRVYKDTVLLAELGDVLTYTATGLTNGVDYDFTVTAFDAADNESVESNIETASPAAEVPDAPTIGTATAGNAQVSVAFTPPVDNGGSAITGYTATSTPGSITASGGSSPIVVTGLTNGVAYTFTVHATNAVGNSAESAASNSATPTSGLTEIAADNFDRANTTSSLGTSSSGHTWSHPTGVWGINSNKAYPVTVTPTSPIAILTTPGGTSGYAEVDFTPTAATGTLMLLVKVIDVSNWFGVRHNQTNSQLEVIKCVAGSISEAIVSSLAAAVGVTKTMRAAHDATSVTVTIDGGSALTYNLTGPEQATFASAANVGFRAITNNVTASSRGTMDNLKVYA